MSDEAIVGIIVGALLILLAFVVWYYYRKYKKGIQYTDSHYETSKRDSDMNRNIDEMLGRFVSEHSMFNPVDN